MTAERFLTQERVPVGRGMTGRLGLYMLKPDVSDDQSNSKGRGKVSVADLLGCSPYMSASFPDALPMLC
jgi:hypothetical protein